MRLLLMVLVSTACLPAFAQDATQHTKHSPGGALWRAVVLPGWGQIYNRQYVKLPFVYGGLGGMAFLALHNNKQYLRYRHAYLYAVDPVAYARYADDAAPFLDLINAGQERLLRAQRDDFRRNRDLSYIGIGLFYGLTVLDAYVGAHLLDFDVDEDLSIRLLPRPDGAVGFHAAWRLR